MTNIFKSLVAAVAFTASTVAGYQVNGQGVVKLSATPTEGGVYSGYGELQHLIVTFENQATSVAIPPKSVRLIFNLPTQGIEFVGNAEYTPPTGWTYIKNGANEAILENTTATIAVPDLANPLVQVIFNVPFRTVAPGTPTGGSLYSWGISTAQPSNPITLNVNSPDNTGSGRITIQNQDLPVNFSSFAAKVKGCTVELSWTTATEINNSHFVIERSKNGSSFSPIGQTNGAGTSYESNSYTYVDDAPANHQNFYRIRQVDFDGQSTTSVVKNANIDCNSSAISIYPNPTTNSTFYVKGIMDKSTIEVYNALGQRVVSKDAENKLVGVSLSGLASGVYHVQVVTDGKTVFSSKLIKD